jgi:hypothetical protein
LGPRTEGECCNLSIVWVDSVWARSAGCGWKVGVVMVCERPGAAGVPPKMVAKAASRCWLEAPGV